MTTSTNCEGELGELRLQVRRTQDGELQIVGELLCEVPECELATQLATAPFMWKSDVIASDEKLICPDDVMNDDTKGKSKTKKKNRHRHTRQQQEAEVIASATGNLGCPPGDVCEPYDDGGDDVREVVQPDAGNRASATVTSHSTSYSLLNKMNKQMAISQLAWSSSEHYVPEGLRAVARTIASPF